MPRARGSRLVARGTAAARTDARARRLDPTGDRLDVRTEARRVSAASSAHVGFQARSRRGWDMSHLLPEFHRSLPDSVQLDAELVALGEDGRPDFHRLSSRVLHGRPGIALTL